MTEQINEQHVDRLRSDLKHVSDKRLDDVKGLTPEAREALVREKASRG